MTDKDCKECKFLYSNELKELMCAHKDTGVFDISVTTAKSKHGHCGPSLSKFQSRTK